MDTRNDNYLQSTFLRYIKTDVLITWLVNVVINISGWVIMKYGNVVWLLEEEKMPETSRGDFSQNAAAKIIRGPLKYIKN